MNDSYRTDICLLYPPYLIALAAIYLASFLKDKDLKQWFSDLSVEMAEVRSLSLALYITPLCRADCVLTVCVQIGKVTNILMELYELWPTVNYPELRPTILKIRQRYQAAAQV